MPEKEVRAALGDGGFLMSVQELTTTWRDRLPDALGAGTTQA